jgi:uncharacterized membrane protein YkoI
MKRQLIITVIATALLAVSASSVLAKSGQQGKKESLAALASQAKITKEQAQATALKRRPGKVEDGELEREHGRLVYSFDIRNARGTIDEVQVSAITGRVVRIEHENARQEAAEKKKESKEKPD